MIRLEQGICLTDYSDNFLKGWIEGQRRDVKDGTYQTVQYQCGQDGCTRECRLQEKVKNNSVVETNLTSCGGSNCVRYG